MTSVEVSRRLGHALAVSPIDLKTWARFLRASESATSFDDLDSEVRLYIISTEITAQLEKKSFDPDQPRDENGRWTDGGSGGALPVPEWLSPNNLVSATAPYVGLSPKAQEVAARISDIAKVDATNTADGGTITTHTATYTTKDGQEIELRAQELIRPDGGVEGRVSANSAGRGAEENLMEQARSDFSFAHEGFMDYGTNRFHLNDPNGPISEIYHIGSGISGQGIATAMLEFARATSSTPVMHARTLTEDGAAFSESVKSFDPDQPRDENGRWTDGVANEISSWDPTGDIPESPRNAGGMTAKTWWAWERGMDGHSFPGYMQAKACEKLGLPVPPNYDEGRYYLGRGFGAPNDKQIEGMINSIANSKPQPELYRGLGMPEGEWNQENIELIQQLKGMEPGDTIDMPLTSTTRSAGVALWYADDRSSSKADEPPVLLKFQAGANGVAVGEETSFFPQDKEVVVNGKFEVVNSSEVTMPYWARNSVVIARGMDDPQDVTVRGVKNNGTVPDDVAKGVIAALEKNPDDDLSRFSTDGLKFTNDRGFSMDNWGEAHVSAWFAQEPKTFHVVELKQSEVYKLGENE